MLKERPNMLKKRPNMLKKRPNMLKKRPLSVTYLGVYLAYIAHENAPGLETPPGRKFARNMIAAWPYINLFFKSDYFIKVLYYRGFHHTQVCSLVTKRTRLKFVLFRRKFDHRVWNFEALLVVPLPRISDQKSWIFYEES